MYETYPDSSFNSRLINPQELPWRFTYVIKTPPTGMPVTLDEVKTFARLDSMDEDALIEMFVQAATSAAEEYMGRSLMQRTVTMRFDFFPGIISMLPRFLATSSLPVPLIKPPLVSVTEVRTLYEDNSVAAIWPLDQFYWLDGDQAEFVIRRGSVPPINVERYKNGFEIDYVAGYGISGATLTQQRAAIPAPIKIGLLVWAAAMYSQRGKAAAAEPPADAKMMLDPYKIIRI